MNAQEFEQLTGDEPEQDDLDRVNCVRAGQPGHRQCGICERCGFPRFIPKTENNVVICNHIN